MSRIVIFGGTNVNLDDFEDPSVKIYLVCDSPDIDERIIPVPNKNILEFYIDEKMNLMKIRKLFYYLFIIYPLLEQFIN